MIRIDGLFWFLAALLICGAHAVFLWLHRRERLEHLTRWARYDERSQKRHDEMMRALDCREAARTTDEYEGEP